MMRNRYLAIVLLLTLVLAGCAAAKKESAKPAESGAPSYQPTQTPPPAAPAKPEVRPVPPDMTFQNPGTNPQMPTNTQPVSTFAVDVDTASYTLARSYLNQNTLPPKDAIRAEEFINYFPQNYPNPAEKLGVYIEGITSPFRSQTQVVQIGLKARSVSAAERKPAILTFVVDTSGSMESGGRLELVKESLLGLVDQLREEDRVAL
ncbi:MAG TPA: von Willebrand factor type A domain-containing protein, partial [Symbiobacteriaceae bacterium]|nr:von Willebrand factor type A domain-containing protein [Symbiobacteriaceae bacterium]